MSAFFHWISSHRNPRSAAWVAVGLFFGIFLAIGLLTYRTYSVTWDEPWQYNIGQMNYNFVVWKSNDLLSFKDRFYGPLFEFALIVGDRLLHLGTTDRIYPFRHLVNFLFFFAGVGNFFFLMRRQFQSWRAGLLGCLLLLLSPRIYADAFYNSKDIPFLVLFLAGITTLILFLDHPHPASALLHGLVCAAAIAVRMPGIYLPALTLLFWCLERWLNHRNELKIFPLLLYLATMAALTFLFYPILWANPLQNFLQAFTQMSHYTWDGQVYFMGRFIDATALPWYYLPVWIAITTPPLYLILFFLGVILILLRLAQRPVFTLTPEKRNLLIFLAYFFGPLLVIILSRSVLYDGWRHLFFIYPALILIAVYGLLDLSRRLQARFRPAWVKAGFAVLIAAQCLLVARFMILSHPYQNVYFNHLAGASLADAKANYEFDYWGLSYQPGLAYILQTDPAPVIRVMTLNEGPYSSILAFPPAEQKRIQFVKLEYEAEYFIGNYRYHPEEYPYPNPVFSVRVSGVPLTTVYKMK
jgi:hypothetical protein